MPLNKSLRHSRPIPLGSFLTSVFLALATLDSSARVKLPKLISDHMIVQQGQQVRLWGTADPGEKITMTFRGQQAAVTTPTNRQWRIQLDSQSAGGPFAMKISGQNEIILNDIYVGEVWVASGQSNMVWPVAKSANPDEEIPRANYPRVRFFRVKSESLVPEQPLPDADGEWESCTPATVKEFSAAAYYFAREIHTQKHVPLGVIQSARSGTAIEAWMSQRPLQAKIFLPILENWKQVQQQYPGLEQKHREWQAAAKLAREAGKPVPAEPPMGGRPGHKNTPSGLFNAMISPLTPFTIRGVLWYQGEANVRGVEYPWTTSFHDLYSQLFPALIEDWRHAWGLGDFPFLYVQLANYGEDRPGISNWAEIRDAQVQTLSLPKTAMAVAIDIGDAGDIHPKNKQEVGRRLSLAARAIAYGETIPFQGPLFQRMHVEKNQVRLEFSGVGEGLVSGGGGSLEGFTIAGEDGQFVRAEARIEGGTVVVSSSRVDRPRAVRYGWSDNPSCNLYNRAGLPASPFRTDRWPLRDLN